MATQPPLYSFPGVYYNRDFFPTISGYLTLSQANSLYLARTGIASSIAISTTFNGAVSIIGLLTLSNGINITGGVIVDSLTVSGLTTLNGPSSIVGQLTFTLAPILPAGFQLITTASQTISGIKTFSNVLTTSGINDYLSITSPTITGSTIVNAGTFNATNIAGTSTLYGTYVNGQLSANSLNTNLITNSSTTLPITISTLGTSSIPTAIDTIRALRIGWNGFQVGQGATDFINCAQGGNGGFSFSATNANFASKQLASLYTGGGLRLYSDCAGFRIDDTNNGAFNLSTTQIGNTSYFNSSGISTSILSACGNSLGVLSTVLVLNTNFVSTYAPFTPQSTSLFNVSHPTTTLGNNLSTNTTQYATVGFVNSVIPSIPASLLPLNNIWTGLNNYSQRIEMTIKTDPSTTCIGTDSGGNLGTLATGSNITLIGQSSGLLEVNSSNETICGGGSGPTVLGNYSGNAVLGSTSQYLGNNNTIVGVSAGNFSTTVVYSNSTCLGYGSLMTASNQITLGRVTETVLIPGNFTVAGQVKLSTSTYTAAISNVLTFIPMTIFFTPIAGMGFVLPLPSAANSGQTFTLRKINAGSGTAIIFSAGALATVWCALNSSVAANQYSLLAVWQSTWLSNGSLFFQIS